MKCNIGEIDRKIRIALGGILLGIGGWYHNWIALIIGIIALGTALTQFCGLYPLLGISTCKNKTK